jgi:hypothetical protein
MTSMDETMERRPDLTPRARPTQRLGEWESGRVGVGEW